MFDVGRWALDAGRGRDVARWMLDVEDWTLDFGPFGHWLLAVRRSHIGRWTLDVVGR